MDFDEVRNLFFELVQIDSPSLHEGQMARRCRDVLEGLGFGVVEDDAGAKLGGTQGNLVATLPGDPRRTPVLLAAHMDTVQPGVGIVPEIDAHGVVRSRGETILGADDKAGVTAILAALTNLKNSGLQHGTIQVVLTVGEEMGLAGSRSLDRSLLQAAVGLCLDCGDVPGTVIVAGPAQAKWQAEFRGVSAHAGVAPEQGISAIKVAAQAVARMPHGRVDKETTVNVGSFMGQGPTNVVRDKVNLIGEARSFSEERLNAVLQEIADTFNQVAEAAGAEVEFHSQFMYRGFHFDAAENVRRLAESAILAEGLKVNAAQRGGGSDANIFTSLGVPTINIGVGYENMHSTREQVAVEDIVKASQIALRFITMA